MRIYLTGFMAAGKSTVGRSLAGTLGARFVDLDREIERLAGASVVEIFARRGEAGFRRFEREALRRTLELERAVVATGGGTLTVADNRRLIRDHGISVWLHPGWATLAARLDAVAAAGRPLFESREQAERLYRSRLAGYRASDVELEIGPSESPDEVASRVLERLEDSVCAT